MNHMHMNETVTELTESYGAKLRYPHCNAALTYIVDGDL